MGLPVIDVKQIKREHKKNKKTIYKKEKTYKHIQEHDVLTWYNI